MKRKEKAKELIDKFFKLNPRVKWDYDNKMWVNNYYEAKQCALISVDEILKVAFFASEEIYTHYLEVKKEIENYE